MHCLLYVGSKGFYKEAATSVISRLIFTIERVSSTYPDFLIDYILSSACCEPFRLEFLI